MEILRYGDYTFAPDFWCGLASSADAQGATERMPEYGVALDATPIHMGARREPRRIAVVFGYVGSGFTGDGRIEDAFAYLVRRLDPDRPGPRLLYGERNDGTEVAIEATVTIVGQRTEVDEEGGEVDTFHVVFEAADGTWRAPDGATVSRTSHGQDLDRSFTLAIDGEAPVAPVLRMQPTAARSANSESYGWLYRKVVTVQNPTPRNWYRIPMPLDIGDTATLVAGGKMLSSGNDVRVWDSETGEDMARTLAGFDSIKTHAWILATIDAGQSRDYHVVYGNASAEAPRTLTPTNQFSNPGFEVDLTGWEDGGSAGTFSFTWVRSTATSHSGVASLRFLISSGADVGEFARYSPTARWPVDAGRTYRGSVWVRSNGTGQIPKLVFHWLDSDGVYMSSSQMNDYVFTPNVQFDLVMDAVAPTGAKWMKIGAEVKVVTAGTATATYFDDFVYLAQADAEHDFPAPDLRADSGTATGGSATTLVETGAGWVASQWIGGTVWNTTLDSFGTVTANTTDTLTVGNWSNGSPVAGNAYSVFRSTALKWVYPVDASISINDGLGMWWIDRDSDAGGDVQKVSFDGPGRWRLMTYGQASQQDAYEVDRWVSASGIYLARARIRRGPQGKSDNYANNKSADGVMLYVPMGISNLRTNLNRRNSARPDTLAVDQVMLLARDAAAEQWTPLLTETTVVDPAATLATANYACAAGTIMVGMALVGLGDAPIPSSVPHTVDGFSRPDTILEVDIDPTGFSIGDVGAEEDIHDLYGAFRLHGSLDEGDDGRPDQTVAIGGYGRSGRIAVPLDNWLVYDAATGAAAEWNEDLDEKVRDCSFAVAVTDRGTNNGTLWEATAETPLRVVPRENRLTNGSFATDISGWTPTTSGTLTAAWSHDAAVFKTAAGSAKVAISGTTTSGSYAINRQTLAAVAEAGDLVTFTCDLRTSDALIQPRLTIDFLDGGGATIFSDTDSLSALADTWYRRGMAWIAPADTASVRVGLQAFVTTNTATGNCWFDDARLDVGDQAAELWLVSMDANVELVAEYQAGWQV